MTTVPAGLAAESLSLRQNVAFSAIKGNLEQAQKIAEIIDQNARSAPISDTRGTNVNITA